VQIDRTIPNNKPDIIIRNSGKRNVCVNRCCNLRRQKCDQQRSRELSRGDSGNTAHVECKNQCKRGNWNHLKLIYKVPQQRTGKARIQGTTQNSHIGHCVHTAGSTDVNVQNIFKHWEITWHVP